MLSHVHASCLVDGALLCSAIPHVGALGCLQLFAIISMADVGLYTNDRFFLLKPKLFLLPRIPFGAIWAQEPSVRGKTFVMEGCAQSLGLDQTHLGSTPHSCPEPLRGPGP